jgi:hypothetical protein
MLQAVEKFNLSIAQRFEFANALLKLRFGCAGGSLEIFVAHGISP